MSLNYRDEEHTIHRKVISIIFHYHLHNSPIFMNYSQDIFTNRDKTEVFNCTIALFQDSSTARFLIESTGNEYNSCVLPSTRLPRKILRGKDRRKFFNR